MFICVWIVFSTKDRYSGPAPRTDMFICVWMVFSTKDRCVCQCVDGDQHQGQTCSSVCGWCSAPVTGVEKSLSHIDWVRTPYRDVLGRCLKDQCHLVGDHAPMVVSWHGCLPGAPARA
ncbi:hypothetical protein Bbelb_429190 [Branchiostoma belcheri]|nr:hypothetical protein Bbelb_429190 [Branchiostoma belcheri]